MRTGRGRVEHLHEVGGGARRGERLEHGVEQPRPTEPPEALPDGVPIPELGRQSPPSDVVNGEIMKRFQKLAVVPALVAPARQHRPEHHPIPRLATSTTANSYVSSRRLRIPGRSMLPAEGKVPDD